MFSFLGGGRSLPFALKGQPLDLGNSGWQLQSAIRKEDNSEVSVFFTNPAQTPSDATNALKRFKTIRHPSLIKYVDSLQLDDGKIYMVCEQVQPVALMTGVPSPATILYGLHQIAIALAFMNKSGFIHGNVQISSVYQTIQSGEWKLFGFGLVSTPVEFSGIIGVNDWKCSEMQQGGVVNYSNYPVWMVDSWMFACFVKQIFQRYNDPSKGKMTNILTRMLAPSVKQRASITDFIQEGLRPGSFFDYPLIETAIFLDNITIKDDQEKINFFKNLTANLDGFPEAFSRGKVMPALMNALEFGSVGPKIFPMILQIAEKYLSDTEFNNLILPLTQRLMNSPDRAIRNIVLESMDRVMSRSDKQVVNDKLFPHVLNGLSDPMPFIRESAIKSVLLFAPNLPEKVVNQDLIKSVSKLQLDPEPGIRANTTICLGKLSKYLSTETKRSTLLPALLNALRDPFAPSRSASLMAIIATADSYDATDIVRQASPFVMNSTLDPDKGVRMNALKLLEIFIKKLRANSDILVEEAEMAAKSAAENPNSTVEQDTQQSESTSASWGSWAVGAVAGAVTKQLESITAAPAQSQRSTSAETSNNSISQQINGHSAPSPAPNTGKSNGSFKSKISAVSPHYSTSDHQGWDGLESLGLMSASPAVKQQPSFGSFPEGNASGGALKLGGNTKPGRKLSNSMAEQLLADFKIDNVSSNSDQAEAARKAELERKKEERRQKIEALKQQRRAINQ